MQIKRHARRRSVARHLAAGRGTASELRAEDATYNASSSYFEVNDTGCCFGEDLKVLGNLSKDTFMLIKDLRVTRGVEIKVCAF